MIRWFGPTGRPIHCLLTKSDKLTRQEQTKVLRETRAALARTGLAHVVSVSGFHIAVAAGACFFVIRWLAMRTGELALRMDVAKLAAVSGFAPVAAYAAIAGDSVPAARAFLMYTALLGALACDRPPDALRALAVAAVVLAIPTPDIAADVSFALSFVSVIALVAVARAERRRTEAIAVDGAARHPGRPVARSWWRPLVRQSLETSVAATVATAPLTAWHFQQVSLVAPLANLLALPLLGAATLLPGLAALPLAGLAPSLADGLLGLAGYAAGGGLALAARLAELPWAAVATPRPSFLELVLCYAALGLWWARRRRSTTIGLQRQRLAIGLVALLSAADVGYWLWERFGNDALRVTFLSVGQGDAAIVELPRGGVLAIDGGGFPGDFDPGERLIAPFLRSRKIRHVEVLALSHPQLDHYGGLAYLAEHFGPREFWSNGSWSEAAGFERLRAVLARHGTRSVVLASGARRRLGNDVLLEVLHPDRRDDLGVNDASLVLRLTYGETSVLFTGDIEQRAEREMLARGATMRSDVLKVPHHGSATSSTSRWLATVAPTIAVISSGTDNRFGFPAPAVVRRLRTVGASVWNTAESGAVRIVSDGRRVRVETARERFEFPGSLW
jgi:competence protein ComEC